MAVTGCSAEKAVHSEGGFESGQINSRPVSGDAPLIDSPGSHNHKFLGIGLWECYRHGDSQVMAALALRLLVFKLYKEFGKGSFIYSNLRCYRA